MVGSPVNLTVRVVDISSQQPIANARVSLKKDGQNIVTDQASDANGVAVFSGVLSGDGYKAFAGSVNGYAPAASPSIKLFADMEVNIGMTPSLAQGVGLIAGSVKDGRTQAPLPGVNVTLAAAGGVQQQGGLMRQSVPRMQPYRIQQVGSSVQTDQSGQFTFNQVPPGAYQVRFQAAGLAEVVRDVVVNPGDTATVETVFIGGGASTPGSGAGNGNGNPNTRGHVLIAEAGRVVQLDPTGQIAWSYPSAGVSSATRLPDGNTLIADERNNQVKIIGPGGEVLWDMGSSISLFSRLSAPGWVAAAKDGLSFLIADTGNNRVVEVVNNQAGWRLEGLNRPRSATYAPGTGNVIVADTGNRRVIEVDRATQQIIWTFDDQQSMLAPSHAVRLEDGNTLITDTGYNRVIMINPQGQSVWFYDQGLNRPRSTIATSFGTYLIADTGNNRVIEVNRARQVLNTVPNLQLPLVLERL